MTYSDRALRLWRNCKGTATLASTVSYYRGVSQGSAFPSTASEEEIWLPRAYNHISQTAAAASKWSAHVLTSHCTERGPCSCPDDSTFSLTQRLIALMCILIPEINCICLSSMIIHCEVGFTLGVEDRAVAGDEKPF